MDRVYVPGMGPFGAKLAIVGESPSYAEVQLGKPFVGPSGKELDRLLRDAGINRNNCWITNVCKYEVPANTGKAKIPFSKRAEMVGIDFGEQIHHLQTELTELNPNCVLALGGTALWALTGHTKISEYRGSIIQGMGRKVVSTYHPAHLLHQAGGEIKGYWNRYIMINDMRRAQYQSYFPEFRLPSRLLRICKSSADLADFIERHKSHDKPAVDIEARECVPICIGIAFTPHEGICVPLWNKEGISQIPDSDLAQCWILIADLLAKHKIVGQNFKYDQDKLRRLGFITGGLASDTLLKSFTINPELPKSLAFNTSVYTDEPFYKNEGMYEGTVKDLMRGCALDACVTKEIDMKMDADIDQLNQRSYYENFLLPLHDMYLDIESEGFCIDKKVQRDLLRKYIKKDEELSFEMWQLVGEKINVASPKQVGILLFHNLKLPPRDGTGEEEITALLNSKHIKKPEHRRICEIILEQRKVRKTIGTYLMALPDYDDKMKTTFFICLETGRSNSGQQDPPIRPTVNIIDRDGKKKTKSMGLAFQTITKHGDIGADVRSQFVPEPGYVFIQADSSQAEARVVFLLADDEDALRDIDAHDYHALTASWFFGGKESDYSKKVLGTESPFRFAGKTLRHAGHLGAGARRATTELNTQIMKYKIPMKPIPEQMAQIALDIFHKKQPKIRNVFHAEVIKCIEKTRKLIAPIPYGFNVELGGIRTFYERYGDELFRQGLSYLPQRAVTENTKGAGLRLRKRIHKIRIIGESHDALLFMIKEDDVYKQVPIIREEFQMPISFARCSIPRRDLIIPCDIEWSHNYMDFRKFQFAAAG